MQHGMVYTHGHGATTIILKSCWELRLIMTPDRRTRRYLLRPINCQTTASNKQRTPPIKYNIRDFKPHVTTDGNTSAKIEYTTPTAKQAEPEIEIQAESDTIRPIDTDAQAPQMTKCLPTNIQMTVLDRRQDFQPHVSADATTASITINNQI
jgi:hypothetical protein